MSTELVEKRGTLSAKLLETKIAIRNYHASVALFRQAASQLRPIYWTLGMYLCELKQEVGHGNWMAYSFANLRELGETDRMITENSERCMRFYKMNETENRKVPANFDPESVRKLMWYYVPEKDRAKLDGDEPVSPQQHYLTFVNQYSKWRRQVKIGHAELPPLPLMRRDLEPTVRDLIELLGADWIATLLDS